MLIDAGNTTQIVERIDELARMLEHGEFSRATTFARDLQREAANRLAYDWYEFHDVYDA